MENNILYFNLIITLFSLWGFKRVYSKYIVPTNYNIYRFKLFEIRDRLALAAMSGIISEKDKNYCLLMKMLNTSIRALDDFSVVSYVKFLIYIEKDKNLNKKVEKLLTRLENFDSAEVSQITKEYFQVSNDILRKHTRGMRYFVVPLIEYVFLPLLKILNEVIRFPDYLYMSIKAEAFDVNSIQESNRKRISRIDGWLDSPSTA